jgi:hypothetical protein
MDIGNLVCEDMNLLECTQDGVQWNTFVMTTIMIMFNSK